MNMPIFRFGRTGSVFAKTFNGRLISLSTRHEQRYSDFSFEQGDGIVFGSETKGLPDAVRQDIVDEHQLTLPMQPGSRSLNLSNSAAIVLYEAWRQHQFNI